jgi:hypothetical protein
MCGGLPDALAAHSLALDFRDDAIEALDLWVIFARDKMRQPGSAERPTCATPTPPGPLPANTKGKLIDPRMLAQLRDNTESRYWSSQQWADNLSCGKSTVIGTKTWQTICKPARERERLARGKRLRRKR